MTATVPIHTAGQSSPCGKEALSVLSSRPQLVSLLLVFVGLPFQMAVIWPQHFPAVIAQLPFFARVRLAVCAMFVTLFLGPLIRLAVPALRQKLKLSYRIKFLGWKLALPLTILVAVYQCVALIAPFAQRKDDVEEAYLWHASGFVHELDGTYACPQFLRDRILVGGLMALLMLLSLSAAAFILWRRHELAFVWMAVAVGSLSALFASPLVLMLQHRLVSVSYCAEPSLLARGAWYSASQGFVAMAALMGGVQLPLALFGFAFHRYPALARAQASNLGGLGSSILAALLFLASVALLCLRESLSPVSIDRARQLDSQYRCHAVENEHDGLRNAEGGAVFHHHHELALSFVVPLAIQGALMLYIMKLLASDILQHHSSFSAVVAVDPLCVKPDLDHDALLCRTPRSSTTRVIAACFAASLCGWWSIEAALSSATRYPNMRCASLAIAPIAWFLLANFMGSIFLLGVAEAVLVVHEDDLAETSERLAAKAEV